MLLSIKVLMDSLKSTLELPLLNQSKSGLFFYYYKNIVLEKYN